MTYNQNATIYLLYFSGKQCRPIDNAKLNRLLFIFINYEISGDFDFEGTVYHVVSNADLKRILGNLLTVSCVRFTMLLFNVTVCSLCIVTGQHEWSLAPFDFNFSEPRAIRNIFCKTKLLPNCFY